MKFKKNKSLQINPPMRRIKKHKHLVNFNKGFEALEPFIESKAFEMRCSINFALLVVIEEGIKSFVKKERGGHD